MLYFLQRGDPVTKRKTELSAMNILMCLLVVFIHIASWTIGGMDKTSVKFIFLMVPWRLSAFVVQGFLFLSGVKLFSAAKEMQYERFLVGRYKKILLPYALWVVVYYLYFICTYGYTFHWSDLFEYLLFGTLCSHFYYIIVAMQFYWQLPLLRVLTEKADPWVLSVGAVLLTAFFKVYAHFQYDDRVFPAYLCYFVIGAVVGRHYAAVTRWLKRFWWVCAAAFAALGFFDAWLTYFSQTRGTVYRYFEVLHLGYCLGAIFFFLALFLRLCEGRVLPRFFALLDRSSYGIYLSHVLFIYIANALAARLGITDMLYAFVFRFVFTYGMTLLFVMGYTSVKEKLIHERKTARSV